MKRSVSKKSNTAKFLAKVEYDQKNGRTEWLSGGIDAVLNRGKSRRVPRRPSLDELDWKGRWSEWKKK